ncbi:MAG: hypothetical protein Kapaf2KO_22630 [Candidatus Kapaibacteriales bacterium]
MEKEKKFTELERLENVANSLGYTLSGIAVALGKSSGYFAPYKARGGKVGVTALKQLKEKFGINPNFIRSGEGEPMLKEDSRLSLWTNLAHTAIYNGKNVLQDLNTVYPMAQQSSHWKDAFNENHKNYLDYKLHQNKAFRFTAYERLRYICNMLYKDIESFSSFNNLKPEDYETFLITLDFVKYDTVYKSLKKFNISFDILFLNEMFLQSYDEYILLLRSESNERYELIAELFYGGKSQLDSYLKHINAEDSELSEIINLDLKYSNFYIGKNGASYEIDLSSQFDSISNRPTPRYSFEKIPFFQNLDENYYDGDSYPDTTILIPSIVRNNMRLKKELFCFSSRDTLEDFKIKEQEYIIANSNLKPRRGHLGVFLINEKLRLGEIISDSPFDLKIYLDGKIHRSMENFIFLGVVDSVIDTSGERRAKSLTIVEEYVE